MNRKIFVNLQVSDLEKSKKFFEEIGFFINQQFTDETAASVVISDEIYAMLLTEEKFKQFTRKEIVDSHKSTEVILALTAESKDGVNELIEKVIQAGGKIYRETEDYGFMYSKSFEDLDGHIWEIVWMDPDYVQS